MAKKSPNRSHRQSSTSTRSAAEQRMSPPVRWAAIGLLAFVVLFGVYRVMGPQRTNRLPVAPSSAASAAQVTGPEVDGTAQVSGGVQRISVDVSNVYNPNVISMKAGVPGEITFSRGQGCTSHVQSSDMGFSADLSGGPQTVKVPALQPGTYSFSCGMSMVFGKVVVSSN